MKVTREAVRAYLIDRLALADEVQGPALDLVRRLEAIQLDPVATVERNQHLVLGARLPGYQPADLEALLAAGQVFEYWANAMCAMPMEDYPVFEPVRRHYRTLLQPALDRLGAIVPHVLDRLEREGPLPARAFATEQRVAGYWDRAATSKATSHALNVLLDAGMVMVARRSGAERHFDLPERVVPARLPYLAGSLGSLGGEAWPRPPRPFPPCLGRGVGLAVPASSPRTSRASSARTARSSVKTASPRTVVR